MLTTITAAFLHADLWHLGGNMLFLWTFGDNVEDAMGHIKFLIFYLACAFRRIVVSCRSPFPDSDSPLIGASGAAAGVVGAYLMLHPKMKIWGLFFGQASRCVIPALWVLGGLGRAFQLALCIVVDNDNQISWAAHVGGVLAGIALVGLTEKAEPCRCSIGKCVVPEAVELEPDAKLPPQVRPSRMGAAVDFCHQSPKSGSMGRLAEIIVPDADIAQQMLRQTRSVYIDRQVPPHAPLSE